jgi:hypothetical protein
MYLRRCYRKKDGKRHAYWALVESYRTARGPRQRVVAWLGAMDEQGRLGVKRYAEGATTHQGSLFRDREPEWVEVDLKRVRVERSRKFGGPWLGLELLRRLELDRFLEETLPEGREEIPWPLMATVLVVGRLCDASSELHLAERFYESSALADLLSVPAEKVNEDRLYRALAQRGYSRDHRPDCKQVNIALVVSRCGMPLGYEIFAGNRQDATTLEEIVEHIEGLYGRASRIWVMDRGMAGHDNVEFLRKGGRRYIVGTAKNSLRKFERELLAEDWRLVHAGLEVRITPAPDGEEVFILCRSAERRAKEQAMHERFEKRIEEGLGKIQTSCQKKKQKPVTIATRVGRLLGRNTRAAALFDVRVEADAGGFADLRWSKVEAWREWARLSEGCYLLRSNVTDWSPEDLWRAYIQLTEAEAAFHIHKSDLAIRPVWHQKEHRVQAHILVCFLTYVLWKTLAASCQQAGLGDEPRQVFEALSEITLVDVVLPTRSGTAIRKRCVSQPTEHQQILLQRLGLKLPTALQRAAM